MRKGWQNSRKVNFESGVGSAVYLMALECRLNRLTFNRQTTELTTTDGFLHFHKMDSKRFP